MSRRRPTWEGVGCKLLTGSAWLIEGVEPGCEREETIWRFLTVQLAWKCGACGPTSSPSNLVTPYSRPVDIINVVFSNQPVVISFVYAKRISEHPLYHPISGNNRLRLGFGTIRP
jgi:hypothetical protein